MIEGTSTMLRKAIFTTVLSLLFTSGSVFADTLIAEGIDQSASGQAPERGQTKASVSSSLGDPASQTDAVGKPPISSWEYDEFVVFFENDYVLHSVAKR
jgi:hypothetical protein